MFFTVTILSTTRYIHYKANKLVAEKSSATRVIQTRIYTDFYSTILFVTVSKTSTSQKCLNLFLSDTTLL